jgi:hypothetical protein
MSDPKRRAVVRSAAVAALALMLPVTVMARPLFAASPRVVLNSPYLCGPCRPSAMVTGAAPWSHVALTVGVWTGERFESIDLGTVGVTNEAGELLAARLPIDLSGVLSVSVEVAGERSQPVIVEQVATCGPPPVLCPGPGGIGAALGQSLVSPGQPLTMTLTGAPAFGELVVVVERLYGHESWQAVEDRPAQADCLGQSQVSLETTFASGVYRAWAVDRNTGATSNLVYYQVQDCPW